MSHMGIQSHFFVVFNVHHWIDLCEQLGKNRVLFSHSSSVFDLHNVQSLHNVQRRATKSDTSGHCLVFIIGLMCVSIWVNQQLSIMYFQKALVLFRINAIWFMYFSLHKFLTIILIKGNYGLRSFSWILETTIQNWCLILWRHFANFESWKFLQELCWF